MTTLYDFSDETFPTPGADLDAGRSTDTRRTLWATLDGVDDRQAKHLGRVFRTLGQGVRRIMTPVGIDSAAGLDAADIAAVRAALYDLGYRPRCGCDHPDDTDTRVGRPAGRLTDPDAPVLTTCRACGETVGVTHEWWAEAP